MTGQDSELQHAILQQQLIALVERWNYLSGQGSPGWVRRGRYNRGYCDAYQAAIRDVLAVLERDW